MSGYNAFIQANMLAAAKEKKLTPERFVLSKGRIGSTNIDVLITESALRVQWEYTTLPVFGKDSDMAFVIVFDASMNILEYSASAFNREERKVIFEHDGSLHGSAESVVVAFLSEDGKLSSNTEFVNINYS